MRILLDTHALLWLLTDDPTLGPGSRTLLEGADSVLASVASLWELAIKHSVGKFPDPEPVLLAIDDAGLELLPVLAPHAMAVRSSPLEHRDPFDRLLLAQAAVESCVLLTADDRILAAAGPQARDARR